MEITNLCSLLSLLILAMAFIPSALATNITTDQSSLLSLKSYTSLSPNHTLANNWSITASVCNWIGVVCGSKHHRVVALDISNMGIVGTLPPQLGNLSFLVSLNISHNSFCGNLPSELANLRRLQYLDFGYNSFSGKIPDEIGNLENAQWLILEVNQLDGSIPFTIFNISTLQNLVLNNNSLSGSLPMKLCEHAKRLKVLHLHFNKLNGDIPRNLSSCSKLEVMQLRYNNFVGTIPREIGSLNMLQILRIGSNNLEGIIPETLFNISALTIISMGNNRLSGTLSPNMCLHLQKLERLSLYTNMLYGNIPRQIGNLTMITDLVLAENSLSGEIPKELGNLDKLEILILQINGLSGSIPREIFNMSTLKTLSLVVNNLSGTLPTFLGHWLPNLEYLNLGANYIGGVIPAQMSNASNLVNLDLSNNQFAGFIPNSLENLAKLKTLRLYSNNLTTDPQFSLITSLANCRYIRILTLSFNPLNAVLPNAIGNLSTTLQIFLVKKCNIRGRIPEEIGNLSSLYKLSLWSNDIIGFLPTTIQTFQSLQLLDISENRLIGSFPDVICELRNLFGIYLGKNKFSGRISNCLGNVSSLREIDLSGNEFTAFPPILWSIENLLRLDLHSNNLSGSLPHEIGNAKTTIHIDLSYNKLSGEIPSSIADLTKLINFSVAHNTIEGSIPDTFGELLDLHLLDLSNNKISGMIPKSLEGLVSMSYFNVSYNRLTGEIPSGGPFANFTYESFLSNSEGLCGSHRLHVPPCPANTLHQSKKNRVVVIVLVSLAVLVVLIASVSVLPIFKRQNREVLDEPSLLSAITPARYLYYELQRATNGFDESNSLGSGSFGSVYKGVLTNGMHVAVKVFRLIHEGANRSFDNECEILRNIRHRNLTKVLGSCSNLNFKALVLEYMPNGCLHKWLHSHNYFLNMIQRVSIMIDVAYALEYLHYGYSNPIIHCDLKPNNILIDVDMVGHLCDFGIAKLLGDGNSIAITNTLATIGYIAPEYGQEGLVSTRSDMYSYGVMLLEVFTKTQPGDQMFSEDLSLRSWVHNALPSNIGQIMDPNLFEPDEEKYEEKLHCVSAIFEIGIKCSTKSPREMMNVKDALSALIKIKAQLLSLHASI